MRAGFPRGWVGHDFDVNLGFVLLGAWAQLIGLLLLLGYFVLIRRRQG